MFGVCLVVVVGAFLQPLLMLSVFSNSCGRLLCSVLVVVVVRCVSLCNCCWRTWCWSCLPTVTWLLVWYNSSSCGRWLRLVMVIGGGFVYA